MIPIHQIECTKAKATLMIVAGLFHSMVGAATLLPKSHDSSTCCINKKLLCMYINLSYETGQEEKQKHVVVKSDSPQDFIAIIMCMGCVNIWCTCVR